MAAKRKQWAADSMEEACNAVKNEQMGLREAARKYNVPLFAKTNYWACESQL